MKQDSRIFLRNVETGICALILDDILPEIRHDLYAIANIDRILVRITL